MLDSERSEESIVFTMFFFSVNKFFGLEGVIQSQHVIALKSFWKVDAEMVLYLKGFFEISIIFRVIYTQVAWTC